MSTRGELSPEQRKALWEQFVGVYADAQKDYDSSIRTLASAGIAVTVSIGTAFKSFDWQGLAAVSAFLLSVALNVASYVSAQQDMNTRLKSLRDGEGYEGAEGNHWTMVTTGLNYSFGAAFIVGAAFLAAFVVAET